ncbi:MAG: hypothetical protein M1831_004203 [Alyxoria varia]|nr:MAG: hypothetical protein M1831_004203 [Alyxoria varia]
MNISQLLLHPPSPPLPTGHHVPNSTSGAQPRPHTNTNSRGGKSNVTSGSNVLLNLPPIHYGTSSPFHNVTLPPLDNSNFRPTANPPLDRDSDSDTGSDLETLSDSDSFSEEYSPTSSRDPSVDESRPPRDSNSFMQSSSSRPRQPNQLSISESFGSSTGMLRRSPPKNSHNRPSQITQATARKRSAPVQGKRKRSRDGSATPPVSTTAQTQPTSNNNATVETVQQRIRREKFNDFNCSICQEPADHIVMTKCKHSFCKSCIWSWIRTKHVALKHAEGDLRPRMKLDCPNCRASFPLRTQDDVKGNAQLLEFATPAAIPSLRKAAKEEKEREERAGREKLEKREKKRRRCLNGTSKTPIQLPDDDEIIDVDSDNT